MPDYVLRELAASKRFALHQPSRGFRYVQVIEHATRWVSEEGAAEAARNYYPDNPMEVVPAPGAPSTTPPPPDLVSDSPAVQSRAVLLEQLFAIVQTIREEQVSRKMGFGSTLREKQQRAAVYAAEIERQANKIDPILEQLSSEEPE